jgi:hypothetical protein
VEHWNTARLLFERPSQAKQVENIDNRLACVSEEQVRSGLAVLEKLHSFPDIEDASAGIEDVLC